MGFIDKGSEVDGLLPHSRRVYRPYGSSSNA